MEQLNINTRLLMFAVCTSIEYDLRNFLTENPNKVEINSKLLSKAVERNKSIKQKSNFSNNYDILVELDMGDLIEIIESNPFVFGLNTEKSRILKTIFNKVIPIRNRVMHTRPIEIGDRSILEEITNNIDLQIDSMNWENTKKTRYQLIHSPQELMNIRFDTKPDFTTNTYHNLPVPEFDDTGFVGRKKEITDIINLIEDEKNQIITIVGNGGIGKTAIAVNCLYKLIDKIDNKYEAVIWVSLKTRTLSKGEFRNIESAITNVEYMYQFLSENMISDQENPKESIFSFMKEFKTLLVLDNLETVATDEIIDFLKEIPEKSKVLITSRNGVGELEYRYLLNGMKLDDAETYFNLLSQYYGMQLHHRNTKDIRNLIKDHLYSSPLSIKWFITSIYAGVDENTILANKEDLITFCMSNIIEKFSENQKTILQLLLLEGKPLTYGDFDYYLGDQNENLVPDIHVLVSTSMLILKNNQYQLNTMAKDYISINYPPSNKFIFFTKDKRQNLQSIFQEVNIKNEKDPFSPKSLTNNLLDENRKLSSFYLIKALEMSGNKEWEESLNLCEKARTIAPDYFEVYKIKAFIFAEKNDLYNAIHNYQIALENAEKGLERATVYYLFSVFYTIKMEDYIAAKEQILKAEFEYPDNFNILQEKARVLMYLGEYEEAENILNSITLEGNSTEKEKNLYITRFSDLYRRISSSYDLRDVSKKFEYCRKSIEKIEELDSIDNKTCSLLIRELTDLLFIDYYSEAAILFEEKLSLHFSIISVNSSGYLGTMKNKFKGHENIYSTETIKLMKKLDFNYKKEATKITKKNEAMIVRIIEYYGFMDNAEGSIYFKIGDLMYEDYEVGDKVAFSLYENQKGKYAKNIKLIEKKVFLDN